MVWQWRKSRVKLGDHPHFLIVKTSSLGDIIHSFPVLRYLKQCYPNAKVDWVVERTHAELLLAHPDVDRVIPIASKAWRKHPWSKETWKQVRACRRALRSRNYDVVFDLQGNIKSGLVLFQLKGGDKVGFAREQTAEWPNSLFTRHQYAIPADRNIREDYLNLVKAYFGDEDGELSSSTVLFEIDEPLELRIHALFAMPKIQQCEVLALICPGSAWPSKRVGEKALQDFMGCWSQRENVGFLIAWGSEEERAVAERLYEAFPGRSLVLDKMPLVGLQRIMSDVHTVIAMDSLPLHLCGTTLTPSFSVFGPSSAEKYCPSGRQHQFYQASCPLGRSFEKRCPQLRSCTAPCTQQLRGDELFSAFWQQRIVG